MATIGTLVVDLKANTATFAVDMGKARKTVRDTGGEFELSKRKAENFAEEGLGAIARFSPRVVDALADLIGASQKGMQALQLFGKAFVAVGTFIAAVDLGNRLRDFIEFGEGAEAMVERLNKEVEAEKKFLAERRTAVTSALALTRDRIGAETEAAAARAKMAEDELGAAHVTLQGRLAVLEIERKQRERTIIENVGAEMGRAAQLTELERVFVAKRIALQAEFARASEEIRQAEIAKATAAFAKETDALLDAVQKRLDFRRQVEAGATVAAGRQGIGDPFAPFRQAGQTRQDMERVAQGFALLLDEGTPFRDLLDEIIRVEEEFTNRGIPGLMAAVENARGHFRELGVDTAGINEAVADLSRRVGDDLPGAINRADPAIVQLIQRVALLRDWVRAARDEIAALEVQLAQ